MIGAWRFTRWNAFVSHRHSDCLVCHALEGEFIQWETVVAHQGFAYHIDCAPAHTLIVATLLKITETGIDTPIQTCHKEVISGNGS
jgi:hypothetical protein